MAVAIALGVAAGRHPAAAGAAAGAAAVRAELISGSGQSAHAWAATGSTNYITDFPQPLDVHVAGPMKPDDGKRRVRYHCITPGCVLAPADGVAERVNPAAYDIDIDKDGHAKVVVTIAAKRPDGTYRITAQPLAGENQPATPATFTLTSR